MDRRATLNLIRSIVGGDTYVAIRRQRDGTLRLYTRPRIDDDLDELADAGIRLEYARIYKYDGAVYRVRGVPA